MECTDCKKKKQLPLKRTKHFELGGEKKRKVCMRACIYLVTLACLYTVRELSSPSKPCCKMQNIFVWFGVVFSLPCNRIKFVTCNDHMSCSDDFAQRSRQCLVKRGRVC